jgi:hypothetical protein
MTRYAGLLAAVFVLAAGPGVALTAPLGTQAPGPPPPESQPAEPPPPAPAVAGATLVFGSEAGLVINPIRPEKTADFEAIVARLRQALRESPDPVRRQQGASWKVLKAAEPGPDNAVLYLFVFDPVVKNADYTVSHLLAEAYPSELEKLWTTLREAYAGAMHRLSLQYVVQDGAEVK